MKKILKIMIFVDFVKKNHKSDKVRDHCHTTGNYRGPAHSKCYNNVTQDQSSFVKCILHNFSKYDSHVFVKKSIDNKMIK